MNGSTVHTIPEYYRRQVSLPQVGTRGQERLSRARVLIIGLGALGSPAAEYLARAGIGNLHIMDGDRVELSNLHRQPLYTPLDQGIPKARSAAARLETVNPHLRVTWEERFFAPGQSLAVFPEGLPDLVLDCTDRFSSRFTIHDACQGAGIPLISTAVSGFTGQLQMFHFHRGPGPCLRCLYPRGLKDGCTGSCAQDGILGASAGIMGSIQALTALSFLLNQEIPPGGQTITLNLTTLEQYTVRWSQARNCPGCSSPATPQELPPAPVPASPSRPGDGAPAEPSSAALSAASPDLFPEDGEPVCILDVRQAWEAQPEDTLLFPRRVHLPAQDIQQILKERPDTLAPGTHYLIICEQGIRSAGVARYLEGLGFTSVRHLEGGIAPLRPLVKGGRP